MFERLKKLFGVKIEDDTIREGDGKFEKLMDEINEERRAEGHPDLKIFYLPELPPNLRIVSPEDE